MDAADTSAHPEDEVFPGCAGLAVILCLYSPHSLTVMVSPYPTVRFCLVLCHPCTSPPCSAWGGHRITLAVCTPREECFLASHPRPPALTEPGPRVQTPRNAHCSLSLAFPLKALSHGCIFLVGILNLMSFHHLENENLFHCL